MFELEDPKWRLTFSFLPSADDGDEAKTNSSRATQDFRGLPALTAPRPQPPGASTSFRSPPCTASWDQANDKASWVEFSDAIK